MDFSFSEEQETVRELAREILEQEATLEQVKAAEDTPACTDEALWSKLADANLLGIAVPEISSAMSSEGSSVQRGISVRFLDLPAFK